MKAKSKKKMVLNNPKFRAIYAVKTCACHKMSDRQTDGLCDCNILLNHYNFM